MILINGAMIKNKIYQGVLAGLMILSVSGCQNAFESINTDPNHITKGSMDYKLLLTATEVYTAGTDWEGWRNSLIYCSTMIQHLSSTQDYWCGDKYTFNAGYSSAFWDREYPNAVTNVMEVLNRYKGDATNVNAYNIARILKVITFQRMTDLYGDVPYTEAGYGYISGLRYPKYDKQQDIYNDLFKELDEAAQALDANATNTLGSADLVYAGDVASWKKLAYSEMLRLAMRISNVDATTAQKWVAKAVQGGLISSNSENAIIQHDATTNDAANANGKVLVYQDANATRLSKTFVDMMKNTQDPRLIYFGTVAKNPDIAWGSPGYDYGDTTYVKQVGMPNGVDELGKATDVSKASNYPGSINNYSIVNRYTFARCNAPTFLLTYAQNQLLLAEAALKGWVSGDAQTYYNNGVKAAMDQLAQTGANPGVSTAQQNTYLSRNPYSSATALEQIGTQYWIASFMDEYEAWSNWRRTGFPKLTPVNYYGNVTNGTIPRRFTYPTSESTVNSTNYEAAVSRLSGGDKMTSRMWWDVAK
jgi:hypothetical protein